MFAETARSLAMATLMALVPTAALAEDYLSEDPSDGPVPTAQYIADVNDYWTGVGIGYDNGLWGSRFGQGLKVDVPFGNGRLGRHFGVRLKLHPQAEVLRGACGACWSTTTSPPASPPSAWAAWSCSAGDR